MPKLAVSILNYRTADLTRACLDSVMADIGGVDAEVIVVDNASGDGSAEAVEAWIAAHPGAPVRLIRSAENGGFSAGHNQAIAASTAEYVLILNSDAEVRAGCLAALLDRADRQPRAASVSARLEGADEVPETSCFRDPTGLSELLRGAQIGALTRLLRRWEVPLGPAPDPARIQWTAFACALLRREALDALGPMDEGYFLYFEDVEFCRRARLAGWEVAHEPRARALHHMGGSTQVTAQGAAQRRRPAYYYAARSRFFAQAYGRWGLWVANLSWHAGRGLSRLRLLAGKPVPASAENEARDIWIGAADPLGEIRRAPARTAAAAASADPS
ncbi:MAG: glycosyltransferase family 2 protein [Pseudomonadota bacterium]